MPPTQKLTVPARIVLVGPPAGVMFALQRGRRELDGTRTSSGQDLRFDFILLAALASDGTLKLSGEFVQGPSGGKFVYVNSGTLAGQWGSGWTRRAKVGLQTLKWATVQSGAAAGHRLQARIAGVGRDGGPACASVPLLDSGWTVEKVSE